MRLINIEKETDFIENLFLIFDGAKTGFINFKEILFTFIISSKSEYDEKIECKIL